MILTLSAIIAALSIATLISVFSIKDLGRSDADQLLHLMCKTGTMNLETYFQSVENSVETVSTLVQDSFDNMPLNELQLQVERSRPLFNKIAYNTNGVLTYYFRIDPEVSDTVKGFWYVNLDGKGFKEHEVTDITKYDTSDTSSLVWFTVPKATGKGLWLPPYITDSLNVKVISYNVPIYCGGQFIGVIGIEIDYETLASEVEKIRLFDHGYAFILDDDSNVIYHPLREKASTDEWKNVINTSCKLLGDNHIQYKYKGAGKEAVWLPLSNGMQLYVTVPLSEINSRWHRLIWRILLAAFVILLVMSGIMLHFLNHLTKPLRDLTDAAIQIGQGNYNIQVDYRKKDEVGILAHTIQALAAHTQSHINDLNKQVYVDSLTSVRNKAGYAAYIQELQDRMDNPDDQLDFAIGVFDCDNLKIINDTYGHDRGDLYLKAASRLICQVFKHSPVFRIGGDEFAVIMQNEDYRNREALLRHFRRASNEISEKAANPWDQVNVSSGMAVYDSETDPAVIDVARRADRFMYENKRVRKKRKAC